ncbi:DUF3304 domain-containing protein [Burkholderia dolosa]|uniref:DUF3304 domain-containing protein n=1 Tax=Burkholderia dolosa TaxID=152500 RepID=UPI001B9F928D|nr:DUF3304 domain-containing protein [Burkholderia dolosa]MBR8058042.1 DUF3304 domain-containing protein [Burkholderia dolosa]
MPLKKMIRWTPIAVIGLLAIMGLSGCKQEPYMLGIVGYNYTDRAVANFGVNGQGGGNIELSTPTAGGGGTSCCVVMSRSTKTPFWVDVKYKMSALESYPPRKVIEPSGPYKEARVEVKGPIPPDPSYLEVHFYPDGHIEAAISGSDGPSPPRLKLERRLPFVR